MAKKYMFLELKGFENVVKYSSYNNLNNNGKS